MGTITFIIDYANRLSHMNNQLFKPQMEDFDIYPLLIVNRLVPID